MRYFPPRTGRTLVALTLAAGVAAAGSTVGCATFGGTPDTEQMAQQAQGATYKDGVFINSVPTPQGFDNVWEVLNESLFGEQQRTPLGEIPVTIAAETLARPPASGLRLTWMGHSTVLVEIDGARVLTDPIWSERASPSSIAGPSRFHPTPVELDELPRVDAIIISHDHYDHLDQDTIEAFSDKGVAFFVPLGVGAHLAEWGVPPEQVTELDWWGRAKVPGTEVTVVATPARHFSGRGLIHRDRTLWASWVVRGPDHRVYFGGDTGIFDGFKEIGQREGPFDASLLPVGAYNPAWQPIHMNPEEAMQAHAMLDGGLMLPIHWSTFSLGMHAWTEPAERTVTAAAKAGVPLTMPMVGQSVEPASPPPNARWWRLVDAVAALMP